MSTIRKLKTRLWSCNMAVCRVSSNAHN